MTTSQLPSVRLGRAIRSVRTLLGRCGSADQVSRDDLRAHEADLLVIGERAHALHDATSPVAAMFTLSDDVEALIRRIAAEQQQRKLSA